MTNQDILNGSQLIVEVNNEIVGFSTSHTFNFTTDVGDIMTKEYGKYPGKIINRVEWEVTCENLASNTGITSLLSLLETQAATGEPVTLIFGQVQDSDWNDGKGTVSGNTIGEFASPTSIVTGSAIVSNVSLNAPAGENATISATFTGVGAPEGWDDTPNNGQQGTQGTQGH